MSVGEHTFGNGSKTFSPSRLVDLQTEYNDLEAIRLARKLSKPRFCELDYDGKAADKIEAEVCAGPWDVIHYSGHSICADDEEVFLVLPGERSGRLKAMRIADFARFARIGRAKLVVLSSCESTSPRAVFELAQEHIPATIGFRWEVLSRDAALFMKRLHTELAKPVPLARAYLEAVRALTPESPTFMAPMLVVQQQSWAEPYAEMGA